MFLTKDDVMGGGGDVKRVDDGFLGRGCAGDESFFATY